MSSKRLLILAAASAALAACSTAQTHIGDEDAFMGEAVKYNAAIQTINPTPVYPPGASQPGDNGAKGAAAVKRYENDKVKQPPNVQSTMGISDGGGTSGSGGPH